MVLTKSFEEDYLARSERSRARRMKWWHQARFGMFIHWGLYSQLGRNEWVMNLERIPLAEYEPLAATWQPKHGFASEWASLAKAAGMKYMVLTTKHHEGFCLWNTQMTDYNAVKHGPGRDLVAEYVEAARAAGLRVGFYYSLMDWHHPDGIRCKDDEDARLRFTDYTRGCVRELMSNYGKIDILWYDVSWPLASPQAWDSYRLNAMVRKLQPEILINDRAQIPEDFGTPEEHINPAAAGRAWEACMTFNGSWGWQQTPPEDWHSTRSVLGMLRTCTAGGGNLLLNIGPHPDGSVPWEAHERLCAVGKWLEQYGEVLYGDVDRVNSLVSATGNWTRKGNKYYYWCTRWPGETLALGAVHGKLTEARLYPGGDPLPFEVYEDRIVIKGLPAQCPDDVAYTAVIELTFRGHVQQLFNMGPVAPDVVPADLSGKWVSPAITAWRLSSLQAKTGSMVDAPCVALADPLDWQPAQESTPKDFINVHEQIGAEDGLVYIGTTIEAPQDGTWRLHLGHDGGLRVFLDGQSVFADPRCFNPSVPGRNAVDLALSAGSHELMIAFDTAQGKGWGIYACFEVPKSGRKGMTEPVFPKVNG
jgi:alpha-L-fucosidase